MKSHDEVIERIKYYMKKQQLMKIELAERSKLPQTTISNVFTRGSIPNVENLQKIIYDGFGITMGEFFEEVPETINISRDPDAELVFCRYKQLSKNQKLRMRKMMDEMLQGKDI